MVEMVVEGEERERERVRERGRRKEEKQSAHVAFVKRLKPIN